MTQDESQAVLRERIAHVADDVAELRTGIVGLHNKVDHLKTPNYFPITIAVTLLIAFMGFVGAIVYFPLIQVIQISATHTAKLEDLNNRHDAISRRLADFIRDYSNQPKR